MIELKNKIANLNDRMSEIKPDLKPVKTG